MHQPAGGHRFTVTALFAFLPGMASFLRSDWPAHVTLAGNFSTDAPVDELVLTVRRAGVLAYPIVIQGGGPDAFGPDRDVPVRLITPGRLTAVHESLAAQLERLPGFTADEPGYWREGYRPHLTLSSRSSLEAGEERRIRQIAIARLSGGEATIIAGFDLPAKDPTWRR